jgi:excisionase family DNA binding protein
MMQKLMTFAEAARLASNSSAWWRKLAARREIAVVKLGRSARLREDDVERIIRESVRPAREAAR